MCRCDDVSRPGGVRLCCVRCAMSGTEGYCGTEIAYGATPRPLRPLSPPPSAQGRVGGVQQVATLLCCYALAMRCPVLRYDMLLRDFQYQDRLCYYAVAMRCPILR
eukprot:1062420-Rhodomonas_salina.2